MKIQGIGISKSVYLKLLNYISKHGSNGFRWSGKPGFGMSAWRAVSYDLLFTVGRRILSFRIELFNESGKYSVNLDYRRTPGENRKLVDFLSRTVGCNLRQEYEIMRHEAAKGHEWTAADRGHEYR